MENLKDYLPLIFVGIFLLFRFLNRRPPNNKSPAGLIGDSPDIKKTKQGFFETLERNFSLEYDKEKNSDEDLSEEKLRVNNLLDSPF